jgi:hypothetical protein
VKSSVLAGNIGHGPVGAPNAGREGTNERGADRSTDRLADAAPWAT